MLPDMGSYSKKEQVRYESEDMSTHGRHDNIEQKGALDMDRRKRELDITRWKDTS